MLAPCRYLVFLYFVLSLNVDIEKKKEAMENIGEEEEEEEEGEPLSWWRMLLNGINPINVEEWPDMPWYSKAYEIFKVI